MEALILLSTFGVLWLVSSRRRRYRVLLPIGTIVGLGVILTSPIGVTLGTQGMLAFLPPDQGESVDAIVVLGRGGDMLQKRLEVTGQLWRSQRSPKIFASGMLDAEFMVEQLPEHGVPKTGVSGERCSQSTLENALFTSAVLRPQGIRKILLVTDAPHLLRSVLAFRGSGFTVVPHAVPLPQHWSALQKAQVLGREYAGLIKYTVSGYFKTRSPEELATPPVDVSTKLVDWNCKLQ